MKFVTIYTVEDSTVPHFIGVARCSESGCPFMKTLLAQMSDGLSVEDVRSRFYAEAARKHGERHPSCGGSMRIEYPR